MTTERLEEFVMLANILNYSKTAEKLFISQPVLSRHIAELEAGFSTKLFVRNKHGVSLTEEGQYLLKWVLPFLEKTERSLSALSESGECSGGKTLNILCSEQSLTPHVISFLRYFMETYPEINCHISPLIGSSKKEMIYSCDVFISPCDFMEMLRHDTEGILLTTQHSWLAIPPFHRFGDKTGMILENLKGETLIVPYADEMFGPYARNAMAANKKCHGLLQKLNVKHPVEGLLMVELGLGMMLLPDYLKSRVYSQTRTIPISDADCIFPIYAYLNHSTNNSSAELFYGKMKQKFLR